MIFLRKTGAHFFASRSKVGSDNFAAGNRPDGVFAPGDVGAISVVAAAGEFGVVIPRDMAGADTQSVQFAPKLIIRKTA